MRITPLEILDYLPKSPTARIDVMYKTPGAFAFKADRPGVRSMALHRMIDGEINKHGYLRFVRLLVPARAARRVQAASLIPGLGLCITKGRQDPGGKTWVPHLEKSKMGCGGMRTHSASWRLKSQRNGKVQTLVSAGAVVCHN